MLSLPIRQGGPGLTSQHELIPAAFIGTLQQALPFFGGVRGVCPPLAYLVGETGKTRYKPHVASDARTGDGSNTGATRKLLVRAREKLSFDICHNKHNKAKAISAKLLVLNYNNKLE